MGLFFDLHMTSISRKNILDSNGVKRAITRLSHEILEANKGVDNLVLVAIRSGGVRLADMIAEKIKEVENVDIPVGIVDITLYRDDLSVGTHHPEIKRTEIDFSIDDKTLVLVDDVLYTGRTVRSAMDAIIDFGRPKSIKLAVLIDRGHRELPIRADFVGRNVPTSKEEAIVANLEGEVCVDVVPLKKRDGQEA